MASLRRVPFHQGICTWVNGTRIRVGGAPQLTRIQNLTKSDGRYHPALMQPHPQIQSQLMSYKTLLGGTIGVVWTQNTLCWGQQWKLLEWHPEAGGGPEEISRWDFLQQTNCHLGCCNQLLLGKQTAYRILSVVRWPTSVMWVMTSGPRQYLRPVCRVLRTASLYLRSDSLDPTAPSSLDGRAWRGESFSTLSQTEVTSCSWPLLGPIDQVLTALAVQIVTFVSGRDSGPWHDGFDEAYQWVKLHLVTH